MKILAIYLLCFIFALSVQSQEIATIKLSYLIENSNDYIKFINDLENKKKSFYDILIEEEKILKDKKNEIEESKMILNDEEINKLVINYNEDVEILATYKESPVFIKHSKTFGCTFHSEFILDNSLHKFFINTVYGNS